MSDNMRVLDDKVVILPDPAPEASTGGIIMPDAAKLVPCRGLVLAAGPGRWSEKTLQRIPMTVKEGDVVMYSRYAGHAIDGDKHGVRVVRESDILAVLGGG